MLYRMSLRRRIEVEEWESYMTGHVDLAGKGKSALVAAAYRSLAAEGYSHTKEQVIGVVHDMAIFFDTISIPVLINTALELRFPLRDMMLSMHQHVFPRIIQCEGFCGEPILITESILAGCRHSVALTRILLREGMANLCIDHPLDPPRVYVDEAA